MRLYDMFDQNSAFGSQQQQQPQQQPTVRFTENASSYLGGSPLGLNTDMNLEQILLELDRLIRTSGITTCALLPPNHDICLRMRQIPLIISQSVTPMQTLLTFVEKVVYMLYKSNTTFAFEAYTGFLQSLFELSREVEKETMTWIVYSNDERKYNVPVIAMLMRHEMIPLEDYDVLLAKAIKNPPHKVEYAVELLSICLLSSNPITFLDDHALTIAALREIADHGDAPSSVTTLLEEMGERAKRPYVSIDKQGLDCLTLRMLLAEWARLCQHSMTHPRIYRQFAKKVLTITKDKNGQSVFFRFCTDTCLEHFLSFKSLSISFQNRTMQLIDAYAKLLVYMIHVDDSEGDAGKIAMAARAFSVVILVLAQHHETRGIHFNQKAFLRILSSMYAELNHSTQSPSVHAGILRIYSDTLYTLQPSTFPGFAFSWLQLISHRTFMPQLLAIGDRRQQKKGWMVCEKLLLELLKFLGPLLDRRQLEKATRQFYRGTLRFLVVLLHDFPEFLSEHYMVFVQVIPHACIQLRNLVLSAFPRIMHLPDPFTPELLYMDDGEDEEDEEGPLSEFKQDPVLVTSYTKVLSTEFRGAIDDFVQIQHESFHMMALQYIMDDGVYRPDILGAFVLYIGSKTIIAMSGTSTPMEEQPAMIAYKRLLVEMTSEGRYILLNAAADHLRYPNSHTSFFSKALLHLFATQSEELKEQITRVLLERLIVNRPHPWGLLATFIGLIKSPGFWDHDFIRCAPDIERLFDNVSRYIKRTT
ncbi:CCR4-Not complex component, Not1-domain-containing protein [Phascolomyces articulosus]|uniref:CCR4-Not complex component, Not1-domain-containing protein n=1 Tax=Phascolomyces articulosus TaxID=60185 RepID=A0AAD5KA74_9FUNG|nr:CCR4-Not complex component, Not1-domain-containing protein [Phascolomyces articulosus]